MIEVIDRVPTYPNRIKITRNDGTSEYVTWERADEPTVEGTPINKALFDSIAEDQGLAAAKTVHVSSSGSDTLGNGTSTSPYATIAKALSTLPKNLNGFDVTLQMTTGTYNEDVVVSGFFGGNIILSGASGVSVTIKSLTVENGASFHLSSNISVGVSGSAGTAGIVVQQGKLLSFAQNVFVTAAQNIGVYVARGGFAVFGNLGVSNSKEVAVQVTGGATVYINSLLGTNNTGIAIQSGNGARVGFNTKPITAASTFLTMYGGRIYTGSQADTPNY